MKKVLHIVKTPRAEELLLESGLMGRDDTECRVFLDILHLGPLCDLEGEQAIEERIAYFNRMFSGTADGDTWAVRDDLVGIKKIRRDSSVDQIYLWLGDIDNERLLTARLLYYFATLNCSIYLMDLSDFPLWNRSGQSYKGRTIEWYQASQLMQIFRAFRLLDAITIQKEAAIWNRLLNENTAARVYNNVGDLISVEEDFFTERLLSNCEPEFKRAAWVIGMTLAKSVYNESEIGDVALNYFLIKTCKQGRLHYRGRLDRIADYEVCLPDDE